MATKTIVTTVTLHLKDEARSVDYTYDQFGAVLAGKTVAIEVPPGKAATLEAAEADRIIARFGGEVIAPASARSLWKRAKGITSSDASADAAETDDADEAHA